jgi:hypothetical protein
LLAWLSVEWNVGPGFSSHTDLKRAESRNTEIVYYPAKVGAPALTMGGPAISKGFESLQKFGIFDDVGLLVIGRRRYCVSALPALTSHAHFAFPLS